MNEEQNPNQNSDSSRASIAPNDSSTLLLEYGNSRMGSNPSPPCNWWEWRSTPKIPKGVFRTLLEPHRFVLVEGELKRVRKPPQGYTFSMTLDKMKAPTPPLFHTPTKREIHGSPALGTRYLNDVLHPDALAMTVRNMTALVRKHHELEYDSIAFRGLSGSLIAPILALRLNKRLLCVRKPRIEESNHGTAMVEGYSQYGGSYVIVDDLIDCGNTVKKIYEQIGELNKFPPPSGRYVPYKPVAIFLYRTQNAETEFKFSDTLTVPVYYL